MVAMSMERVRSGDRPAGRFFNQSRRINVGGTERFLSLLGGGALAAFGLGRRHPSGLLLAGIGGLLAYRGATGHCSMYEALGMTSVEHRERTSVPSGQGIKIEESVTILRSPEELYGFWRRLENLPRVMRHLVSVKELDGNRSHWVARGLTGEVAWDAEIINDRPNELIAWRSLDDSQVSTAGSLHFQPAPGNRGTEVKVVMSYVPPAGSLGAGIAWITGRDPQSQIREDLRSFKRLMETGTQPTTEGQPRGSCCG
jgi:uncharacterized membrane protein